ncbi:hypothetical protein BCR33DRAFT_766626 [Rhizoclosmatium globosum]|uniref:Uncharacterized protein n=1 Tax=Rhizoclosmatium globosum TaxID=329046 RepID=A0A1Y2C9A3_9FUNG|nr:hypothetical protein BCR33DRAFT_766626 [Rhizoclosmatium globosum]|eukprot:ORY43434.1 hypothetical protein BCR33DRAFT_766626 [Rhizoclosmatium globosum]
MDWSSASHFIIVSAVLTGTSVIGLIALTYFILYHEIYERNLRFTLHNIATSFNTLLFLMGVSLVFIYSTNILRYYMDPGSLSRKVTVLCQDLFISTFEICYCIFSFKRTSPVVELEAPLLVVQMGRVVRVVPFLFYLQVIPAVIELAIVNTGAVGYEKSLQLIEYILAAIAAVIVVTLDTVLLTTFIRFLRKTKQDENIKVDERFLIIVKYGVFVAGCAFTAVGFYSAFAITIKEGFLVTFLSLMSLIFWGLLAMKCSLFYEDVRRGILNQSNLERVLGKKELQEIKESSQKRLVSVRIEKGSLALSPSRISHNNRSAVSLANG